MGLHCVRAGEGRPLLMLHGLGGSWRTWCPILPALRRERDVVGVDLPGFGDSLPLAGPTTVTTLTDAVTEFLGEHHLFGVDVAGVDLGGRVALELLERGVAGAAVVFSPIGIAGRAFRPVARVAWLAKHVPDVVRRATRHRVAAAVLFRGYSTRLGEIPQQVLQEQLEDYGRSRRFGEVLRSLRHEEEAPETIEKRVVVGWGRQDRICPPKEVGAVQQRYPRAEIAWMDRCGHFPQWDQPTEMVRLILGATDRRGADPSSLA